MRREFLVKKAKDIHKYLQKNSDSCKLYKYEDKKSYMYEFKDYTYVLQEYKKPLAGLNILVLVSKEDVHLDKTIEELQEITDDKNYSKKYLKLFGNPKNHDFNVSKVFKKCDSVGLARMDLHFELGMSSVKVFRVLLYRLNQLFALQYSGYLKKTIEYEELQNTHKKLTCALELSTKIFDKRVIKNLLTDFSDLYMLLNHQDTYERYALNFDVFIQEESFYNTAKSNKPIYFFDEKEKVFELAETGKENINIQN